MNDRLDPEYMLVLQKQNYQYRSKRDCCENHFWWRVAQCMVNEHPLYRSNGDHCEVREELEDMEVKYTPAPWDTSDLFETLEECCNTKHWWDVEKCLENSDKRMVFDFTFDLLGLIEPTMCQDADIIANALVKVIQEDGLGGGHGSANVT